MPTLPLPSPRAESAPREQLARIWLCRPCCTLSWDTASTLASRPSTRVGRKTRDWLQLRRTARPEWMALTTQEVVATFLPSVASAFAASQYFRSWNEKWSRAGPAASTRKLLIQEGLDPASRSCTFRVGHPPRSRSCSRVCSVQDPRRMVPRQCQRLGIRMLRPGRTRTFATAPVQRNIPIDGLFPFTLSCAIQNPWYLPAAFWFRYKQQVLPHVGTFEAVGNGRRYTASKGARIAHPSRPFGAPSKTEKGATWEGDAGAAGRGGLTSSSMAGRRGLSALTNAACCAAVKGSAGSPGEVATNASVRQHRDVGVPRNRPQQLPLSHHLTTVSTISPDCPMGPPLHNLYVSAARFSSNQSLSASLCTMSLWRSPMHFRVHVGCRTATRQRTEVPREDERRWDWTSTVKRSDEDSAEKEQEAAATRRSHSAPTEADSSNRAKQEPGGPAATKTEPSGIFLCGGADRQQ